MSKSIASGLYDAFTANGATATAWEDAGVTTTYDEDEKTLVLSLPEGWIGTMSPEARARRAHEWCIDDPMYKVRYAMNVRVERDDESRVSTDHLDVSLLPKPEGYDETFELRTRDDDEWTLEAVTGSRLFIEVRAFATLAKGDVRELPLFEGNFVVPEKVAKDVGGGSPGYFFVVDGGFALIVSVGEDGRTPRRMTFVGKLANLEKDVN